MLDWVYVDLVDLIKQFKLYRSNMFLSTFKVITYVHLCKCAIFLCSPASLDIPRGVLKVGRTNMVSKHEIYRGGNTTSQSLQFELGSHGPIHKVWYLEYSQGPTPHFFDTFAVSLYSAYYVSLSLIPKLKLNSWVLEYSSTHSEYLSTWVLEYSPI